MKVVIFSVPQRKDVLSRLLEELKGYDTNVIDDENIYGKRLFWARWEYARRICLASKYDDYLIIPDDISNLKISVVKSVFLLLKNKPFFCNLINDGRVQCWGEYRRNYNDFNFLNHSFLDFGYFDCGGLTNRKTLSQLEVKQPPYGWFDSEYKSSGVGYQLTMQARELNIPMFTPFPTLCRHGEVESVMNYEERKINPLKT